MPETPINPESNDQNPPEMKEEKTAEVIDIESAKNTIAKQVPQETREQVMEEEPIAVAAHLVEDAMQDIQFEMTRLSSRNAGNLKFELTQSLYPILGKVTSAVRQLVGIMATEELLGRTEEVLAMCEAILTVDNRINDKIRAKLNGNGTEWDDIVDWADEMLKEADGIEGEEDEESEEGSEGESDADEGGEQTEADDAERSES